MLFLCVKIPPLPQFIDQFTQCLSYQHIHTHQSHPSHPNRPGCNLCSHCWVSLCADIIASPVGELSVPCYYVRQGTGRGGGACNRSGGTLRNCPSARSWKWPPLRLSHVWISEHASPCHQQAERSGGCARHLICWIVWCPCSVQRVQCL